MTGLVAICALAVNERVRARSDGLPARFCRSQNAASSRSSEQAEPGP